MKMQVKVSNLLLEILLFGLVTATSIKTDQGEIEGVTRTARNGDAFSAFYGIPFAQPPTAATGGRWRTPRPADKWDDVLKADAHKPHCLQNDPIHADVVDGSEDCLYLNVFTKHAGDSSAKKNVLVWIHGGAFIFGGAQPYLPEYIMEEDVVLVVVQYRLNMFGFLSFEDSDSPGNYGMLDQVEALKWVQRHITSYGGDPASVTVFGMSAGGASVHYLVLSPLTTGLFVNAISLSGSALCWWANVPNQKNNALKLAEHFKCPVKAGSSESALDCLRQVPGEQLMAAHSMFFDWMPDNQAHEPMNVFSPRSDPEAQVPFMPEQPFAAMTIGRFNHVPYMLGYVEKEGIWRANLVLPDVQDSEVWKGFRSNSQRLLPLFLGLFGNQTADSEAMAARVASFYGLSDLSDWPSKDISEERIHALLDAMGDSMFVHAIDTTLKVHSANDESNTYFYYLSFDGEHTLANFRTDFTVSRPQIKELRMASHGTDMLLLFPMFTDYMGSLPETDVAVSRAFIRTLVDFARQGKPAHAAWRPFDVSDPTYLEIDSELTVRTGLPFKDRTAFWDGLDVYWKYSYNPSKQDSQHEKSEL